jgi:hypothetical protein
VVVYLSPDEDPGTTGSVGADGTTERSVNVEMASAALTAFRRCGVDARFNPAIGFVRRVEQANAAGAALLVAFANNESTPGQFGTEFVFCDANAPSFGRQRAVADAVARSMVARGLTSRIRGDAYVGVYECCAFNGDTLYLEASCMSPDDQHFWGSPAWRVATAEAVVEACASVYGFAYVTPTGQGGTEVTNDEVRAFMTLARLVLQVTWPDSAAVEQDVATFAAGTGVNQLLQNVMSGAQPRFTQWQTVVDRFAELAEEAADVAVLRRVITDYQAGKLGGSGGGVVAPHKHPFSGISGNQTG